MAWHDAVHPHEESETKTLSTLASLARVALRNADHNEAERNFFTHVTEIIVMALDAREGSSAGGCHAVAQLANRIGRELGLDDEALRRMHFAALLADIGWLKLSPAQQRHPQSAARHPAINITDDLPAPPQDALAFAAELLGVEPPPEVAFEDADLSAMARSFYAENKRVSNALLTSGFGYRLRYPTYREGLAALSEATASAYCPLCA